MGLNGKVISNASRKHFAQEAEGGGVSYGVKQVIYNAAVLLSLYSFFNIVSEHCGRCGGGGLGALPQKKNLSKTGSFSRKNTPFYTYHLSLKEGFKLRIKL